MEFLNELKPTHELTTAVQTNSELRAKAGKLSKQMADQRKVVNTLSEKVDDLLEAQRKNPPQAPEDIIGTKRECVDLSQKLEEEKEFLEAIGEAHMNTLLDAEKKGRYIKSQTEKIIANMGKEVHPNITAQAGPVIDAWLVSWLAQYGLIGNPIETVMRDMSVMLHQRSQNLVLPLGQIQAAKKRLLELAQEA